jgi:hypothetical protein
LEELCGIQLSHTKIGEIADEVAGKIEDQHENNPAFRDALRDVFQEADGETEFYADGTCIRTRNDAGEVEYREVRVGAYAKRVPGESEPPERWAKRKLPKPSAVSAFAAIESAKEFQERCQDERRRLGVGGVTSALGDVLRGYGTLFVRCLARRMSAWTFIMGQSIFPIAEKCCMGQVRRSRIVWNVCVWCCYRRAFREWSVNCNRC